MRMGNGDGSDAAARFHFGDDFIVEQRNAIAEEISATRLQEQCALADRELRLAADAEKLRRLIFEAVAMIGGQAFQRRPLLAAVMNKLPLIFANCAARRRLGCSAKLCAALHADEVFHRDLCL